METGGRSGRGEGGGIPGAGDVVVAREEGDLHWRVHAHDALGGIVVRVQIETLGRRAAPRLAGCGGWGERRGRATALWARAVVPAEALLVPHPAAPQTKVDTTAALGADKGAHLIERPALAAPLLAHVLCGPAGGPRIDAGRRAAGHRRARGLGCIGCGRGLTEPAISLLVAGLTAAQAEIAMADAAGAQRHRQSCDTSCTAGLGRCGCGCGGAGGLDTGAGCGCPAALAIAAHARASEHAGREGGPVGCGEGEGCAAAAGCAGLNT
eukprot:scaffold9266_cov110-Isochrysis_galbana.AAC.6